MVRNDVILFFFSSRRRHTRCSRDWSSDVCSSDLARVAATAAFEHAAIPVTPDELAKAAVAATRAGAETVHLHVKRTDGVDTLRSEERRGGKEWRSRGAPAHRGNKARIAPQRANRR